MRCACRNASSALPRLRKNIISKIRGTGALEMTTLKLITRAMSKAIMDVYGEALVLDGDSEQQHMDRVYIQVSAMEDAKEYFRMLVLTTTC